MYPYIQDTSLNINVNVNEGKVHAWPSSTSYANITCEIKIVYSPNKSRKKNPRQSVREISYMKYICNFLPTDEARFQFMLNEA